MLNQRDLFDKQLMRLDKELRALWRKRWIRVSLDEPIQRGWRRFHVLTPKAENRADKEALLALLKIIGTNQFRNSPNFSRRRGRGRRKRFIEIEQPLRKITIGEWERLQLPEAWRLYFREEQQCHYRSWRDVLIFRSPYIFELRVEPYWITEVCIPDPEIEQRIAEIDGWLRHRNATHRLNRIRGYRSHWFVQGRREILEKIAQRELREANQNPSEVDPSASARRVRISFWQQTFAPRRSSTRRGTPLRPEPVRVRILPPGPLSLS